jgi:hypothetical protein
VASNVTALPGQPPHYTSPDAWVQEYEFLEECGQSAPIKAAYSPPPSPSHAPLVSKDRVLLTSKPPSQLPPALPTTTAFSHTAQTSYSAQAFIPTTHAVANAQQTPIMCSVGTSPMKFEEIPNLNKGKKYLKRVRQQTNKPTLVVQEKKAKEQKPPQPTRFKLERRSLTLPIKKAAELFLSTPYFMGKYGTHGQEIHLAAAFCEGVDGTDTHRPNPRKEG